MHLLTFGFVSYVVLFGVLPTAAIACAKIKPVSMIAPYRVVNIGNFEKIRLLDFIGAMENCLGQKAKRNYMEMQMGDVKAMWADADLLEKLTGYGPNTGFRAGIARFIEWYRDDKDK